MFHAAFTSARRDVSYCGGAAGQNRRRTAARDRRPSARRCTGGRRRARSRSRRASRSSMVWSSVTALMNLASTAAGPSTGRSTSARVGIAAARAEPAAVERGDGIRIGQRVLDVAVGREQAAGREPAAERVARAGACRRSPRRSRGVRISRPPHRARLPSSPSVTHTSGEANSLAIASSARPGLVVAGQLARKVLRGDDRVDLPQQIGDAGANPLDVDNRR